MTVRPATTFLRLALRRAARGTGSDALFLAQRTAMQAIPQLDEILGAIRWVLVGGIALRAYIPERMTLDVDILVHERDSEATRAAFVQAGYSVTGLLTIGGFTVRDAERTTQPIDVLTRADSWLDAALARPNADPAGYPVLPRPYLILMKLQAGRTRDLSDVQRLVAFTTPAERTEYTRVVQQFSPELTEDLQSLYTLADLEFGTQAGSAT